MLAALRDFREEFDEELLEQLTFVLEEDFGFRLQHIRVNNQNEAVVRMLIDHALFRALALIHSLTRGPPRVCYCPEERLTVTCVDGTVVSGPCDYAFLHIQTDVLYGVIEAKHFHLPGAETQTYLYAEAQLLLQLVAILTRLRADAVAWRAHLRDLPSDKGASEGVRHHQVLIVCGLLVTGNRWYLYTLDELYNFRKIYTLELPRHEGATDAELRHAFRNLLLLMAWLIYDGQGGAQSGLQDILKQERRAGAEASTAAYKRWS